METHSPAEIPNFPVPNGAPVDFILAALFGHDAELSGVEAERGGQVDIFRIFGHM